MVRVHFSGPLAWTTMGDRTLLKDGSAACSSKSHSLTRNPDRVDCKQCMRCMRLAGLLEDKARATEAERLRSYEAMRDEALTEVARLKALFAFVGECVGHWRVVASAEELCGNQSGAAAYRHCAQYLKDSLSGPEADPPLMPTNESR
jgi:hypothetical protein